SSLPMTKRLGRTNPSLPKPILSAPSVAREPTERGEQAIDPPSGTPQPTTKTPTTTAPSRPVSGDEVLRPQDGPRRATDRTGREQRLHGRSSAQFGQADSAPGRSPRRLGHGYPLPPELRNWASVRVLATPRASRPGRVRSEGRTPPHCGAAEARAGACA